MGYKKHNWLKYGKQGEILKIIVCDNTEAIIEKHVLNAHDKNKCSSTSKILKDKYGIDLTPKELDEFEERITKDKKGILEKDFDW